VEQSVKLAIAALISDDDSICVRDITKAQAVYDEIVRPLILELKVKEEQCKASKIIIDAYQIY